MYLIENEPLEYSLQTRVIWHFKVLSESLEFNSSVSKLCQEEHLFHEYGIENKPLGYNSQTRVIIHFKLHEMWI